MNDELWFVPLEFAADGGEKSKQESKKGAVRSLDSRAPARGKAGRGLNKIIANQPVCAGNPSQRF